MKTAFITQLILRLKSESPRFFKLIQAACVLLASVSAVAMLILENNLLPVPNKQGWEEVFKALTSFFSGSFIAALLSTNNPALMDEKTKGNVLESADGSENAGA